MLLIHFGKKNKRSAKWNCKLMLQLWAVDNECFRCSKSTVQPQHDPTEHPHTPPHFVLPRISQTSSSTIRGCGTLFFSGLSGPSTLMQTEVVHFPGCLIVAKLGHLPKDTQGHGWALPRPRESREEHLTMQPQAVSAEPFSLSPDKVFCLWCGSFLPCADLTSIVPPRL